MAKIKAKKKEVNTEAKVVKKSSGKETVIKEEKPLDHAPKHNIPKTTPKTVGINIGVTRNMGDYESLRIDVWCTDEVQPSETMEEAIERLSDLAKSRIDYEVECILAE